MSKYRYQPTHDIPGRFRNDVYPTMGLPLYGGEEGLQEVTWMDSYAATKFGSLLFRLALDAFEPEPPDRFRRSVRHMAGPHRDNRVARLAGQDRLFAIVVSNQLDTAGEDWRGRVRYLGDTVTLDVEIDGQDAYGAWLRNATSGAIVLDSVSPSLVGFAQSLVAAENAMTWGLSQGTYLADTRVIGPVA